jgi:hypothetical protein
MWEAHLIIYSKNKTKAAILKNSFNRIQKALKFNAREKNETIAKFEFLTVAALGIHVFWDVTLCCWTCNS